VTPLSPKNAEPRRPRVGMIAAGWGERLRGHAATPKPLVSVGGQPLIQRVLQSIEEVHPTELVCIVNEASLPVREFVQQLPLGFPVRWIVRTTPSSLHSFLAVLEALAEEDPAGPFLMTTVDTLAPRGTYRQFAEQARQVVLRR